MGKIGLAVALVLAGIGGACADEVFRWVDKSGHVHFSNVPAPGATSTGIVSEPEPQQQIPALEGGEDLAATEYPGEVPPAGIEPPAVVSEDEEHALSASVSLQRSAIERDIRSAEQRSRDIDSKLGQLERARTRHADGSDATGGLGSNAANVRSEEEKALASERDALKTQVATAKSTYAKLRQDVTERLGRTPEWWIDIR